MISSRIFALIAAAAVFMDILFLILGLGTLILGGEMLVKGAVGFSATMKLSPLVIGMTVVAFGTSAPELIVSLTSALGGEPGIAVGNVVGSNIANLALVLGITTIIFPIVADRQTKRVDIPMLIATTFLFYFFAKDGELNLFEGVVMVVIIISFTWGLISWAKNKSRDEGNEDWEDEIKEPSFWRSILYLSLGFVGLYFGADWFIEGAVGIADVVLADHPQKHTIIGVTVVAFGTSVPELVASCVAAYRKQTDISMGNLIGSNIFNILVVLGITSIVTPIPVDKNIIEFDILWVIGVAILTVILIAVGSKIGRWKGVVLALTYVSYIVIIVLKVTGKL